MLRTFVPLMLSTLEAVITSHLAGSQNEDLKNLFVVVAEVTDADPLFWADQISQLFILMSQVVLSTNFEFRKPFSQSFIALL